MKKYILLSFMCSFAFGYYDFGTVGDLYDVKEKNLIEEIRKQLTEKKDEFRKMAEDAFEKGLIYKKNIPYSQVEKTVVAPPVIKIPNFGKEYKKQSLADSPYNIKDNMCFVSFENFKIFDKIIQEFGKDCRYVLINIDIRKITSQEKYSNLQIYLGNDEVIKMFDIDATPVKLKITKNKITKEFLDYPKIKKEVELEEQNKKF